MHIKAFVICRAPQKYKVLALLWYDIASKCTVVKSKLKKRKETSCVLRNQDYVAFLEMKFSHRSFHHCLFSFVLPYNLAYYRNCKNIKMELSSYNHLLRLP